MNDVDIFEINEAFASQVSLGVVVGLTGPAVQSGWGLNYCSGSFQALYCVEKLGIPAEKGVRRI